MTTYKATFENGDHIVKREIPGDSESDARAFAQRCAKNGYKLTKFQRVTETHNCHYCGQSAYKRGFFGEWACNECS